MHTRRLVKRSVLGSRVYTPSPTGDGAPLTGVVQAVKQENRDVSTGPLRNVYTLLMQDGSLKEFSEDEIAVGFSQTTAKGPLKSSLKVCLCVTGKPAVVVQRCFAAFNCFVHRRRKSVLLHPLPAAATGFYKLY